MKKLYAIGYFVFVAAVVFIAIVMLASAVPIPGNLKIKIVQSGSMEPAIKIGSVVFIKPQAGYKEGDIITFGEDSRSKVPTTHRVSGVKVENGATLYQTKGDANDSVDTKEVKPSEVIGRALFSIPYLGYLLDFAKKPIGFVLIIGIPAALVVYDEAMKIKCEIANRKTNGGK